MSAEVWIAGVYGVVLLGVAYALDLAARRTAARSGAWRSGSFSYHEDHDAWRCPEDQWLWPTSFDPDQRVMRYRASPTVCNACPVKDTCTTSPHGREVTRNVDPWPSSEAERFHRGVACTVAVLGVLWPALSMIGADSGVERLTLLGFATAVALGSWPLWSHLRRSPDGFPVHVRAETLDEAVAGRPVPSRYASQRRATDAVLTDGRTTEATGSSEPAGDPTTGAGWSRLGRRS